MALTPFTSTITAATFNANFDDKLAAIAAVNAGGVKARALAFYFGAVSTAGELRDRSVSFIAGDDYELSAFIVRCRDSLVNTITVTLTVDGGDADYLNQETISISMPTLNGTVDSRVDDVPVGYQPDRRTLLKKGVRYTITATASGGNVAGPLRVMLYMLGRRRDA